MFSVEVTYADGTKARETMADMSYSGTETVLIGEGPGSGPSGFPRRPMALDGRGQARPHD